MNKLVIPIILFLSCFNYAQMHDSTRIEDIKVVIDSLSNKINYINNEIQQLKRKIDNSSYKPEDIFENLLSEDDNFRPDEQRLKNKRVDNLLRLLRQQPGVLRFNGSATSSFQHGLQKSINSTAGAGSFDIYALTSFGKGTLLFFDIEAIGGNGIDYLIPTFSGLNGDAGSLQDEDGIDRLQILEAWGEFTLFNELLIITAGKIDLTNYFDINAYANDETLQFLSNSFVNNNSFFVPGNSPGLRLRTSILDPFYLQFGLVSSDNSGNKLFEDLYKIYGLGFRIFSDSPWEGNISLYGYQHPLHNDSPGYGISFDKKMFGEYRIFARYGQNSEKLSEYFGISSAWSGGVSFISNLKGFRLNIGLAYGVTYPKNQELLNEKQMEIYTRYQINEWVYLSPHLQFVWSGKGTSEDYSALGLRTHFNF